MLIISFGGPGGLDDIRPFVANVLRGRSVSAERIEEVVRHYELFGGVSPLTELTFRQARGIEERLRRASLNLPVYVGMRNWHPFLADTMANMAAEGVHRAIGVIAAAHGSYSSCTQYKENLRDARRQLVERGLPDVQVVHVDPWFEHEGFIAANADHILKALSRLESAARGQARIIFTAHSIPERMARNCRYDEQLRRSCRLVMERLRREDWALVYQSRSGRPGDPWLGPDINEYLRAEHAGGLRAAVISPIGFLCEHIEVLYDLDHQAADTCRELGLAMVRAETVNAAPGFLDAIAGQVRLIWDRYGRFPPLPITGAGIGA